MVCWGAPCLLVLLCAPGGGAKAWEPEIQRFEAQDKAQPPPKGGILFVGSSTIRMWNVEKWFPNMPVLNRGFGGSTMADVNQYAERIVFPYAPKTIVFYSGDNDIAMGKAPEVVGADFKAFAGRVREKLPETRLIVISIKPSVARWTLWAKMQEANRLIREFAAHDDHIVYVDCVARMLGADGKPRKELFLGDGLHLNESGYAAWTELVMPHLKGGTAPESH